MNEVLRETMKLAFARYFYEKKKINDKFLCN